MNRTYQIPAVLLLVVACCALPVACNTEQENRLDDIATAEIATAAVETNDIDNATEFAATPKVGATAVPSAEATVEAKPMKPDATSNEVVPMTIGSAAPKLDIEHWVQDGGGHFAKSGEFEQDKVYVVEFWATWCGPCIASMPHIAALQQSYADRGVQVISITREDVETVETFLDREVAGRNQSANHEEAGGEEDSKPKTYRDLTSVYCLTADPDGSTSRDYMQAANRNGIPCAFIVGKDSKIEWIGHPMGMDEPLEEVVSGAWDRDAFAAEYLAEQKMNEVLGQVTSKMRKKQTKDAIAILDGVINDVEFESQHAKFRAIKFQVFASDDEFANEAAECALELLADESLDASGVNNIAWTIYQLSERGQLDNEEVLQAALKTSQKAVDSAGARQAYLLDTVAHLHYALGDRAAALKTQQSAMEVADPAQKSQLTGFLKQLEKEIKADQESSPDETPAVADESVKDAAPEE